MLQGSHILRLTGILRVVTLIIQLEGNRPFGQKACLTKPVEVEPPPEVRAVKQVRNDLLTCALAPPSPVGARLSDFRQAWERVITDKWTLNIIRKGYLPEFTSHLRPQHS